MKAYERLLKYVQIHTAGDKESSTIPSSACQFDLGRELARELRELGVEDAVLDEKCYVYAHIPATPACRNATPIGFIAHMDTVSEFCDHKVSPVITENYDGGDLPLGDGDTVLSPDMFPHLSGLAGRRLITSDGTTILGADDKAGVAEIMTMVETLLSSGAEHGPISIGFTPDEEIGRGADEFDVAKFGADLAYTVDGCVEGELSYETFNAATATVTFSGINVHPGSAKGIMINAQTLAMEYDSMLPVDERPENTDGRQGFYHLSSMEGSVGSAALSYLIRDFESEDFERRQQVMRDAVSSLNRKYRGECASGEPSADGAAAGACVTTDRDVAAIEIKLQYNNMAQVIEKNPEVISKAEAAMKAAGVPPVIEPVRGGTDGSRLSFMGLPCPNLGTGGHAFHGPYEHITVEAMDSVVEILLSIVSEYSEIQA